MAIIQEKFDVPEEIYEGLVEGIYRRTGGVVREATGPNKGQIVKLLEPIDEEVKKGAKSLAEKVAQFAKNNKVGLIVGGVVAIAVAGGSFVCYRIKKREPIELRKFRSSLKTYLDAVQNGKMDEEIIDDMMTSIALLKKHKKYAEFRIVLSAEELDVLITKIHEYTIKLAKDNSVELTDEEQTIIADTVDSFERNLRTQKRIFKVAA